jgi:hypothetical protein
MGQLLGPVARATYYVGVAMRWTVRAVSLPYRAVAGRATRGDGELNGLWSAGPRHRRVASTLSRISNRVAEIERALLAPERQALESTTGAAGAASSAASQLSDELVEELSSPDPKRRQRAQGELGRIADADTVVLILDGLQDTDPGVRCAAADAAANAGQFSSVFSLILLLDDPVLEVRQQARSAIEQIVGREIDFDPSQTVAKRRKKIDKLKDWWKEERFSKLAADLETVYKT